MFVSSDLLSHCYVIEREFWLKYSNYDICSYSIGPKNGGDSVQLWLSKQL